MSKPRRRKKRSGNCVTRTTESETESSEKKSRKRSKRRKKSSGRYVKPTAESENDDSGRCTTPTVTQDEKGDEMRKSSTPVSGELTTTSAEKPDVQDDPQLERLTASSPQELPRNKAPKTSCREYKTKSGRVSRPPRWLGDTIHLAYRDSMKKKSSTGSSEWEKARDEMQMEIAKEKAMDWWQDFCCISASVIDEPETLDDAITSDYAKEWRAAADTEYHALMKNGTWELVPREKGMKVLGNRWILKVKYRQDGEIERFKARLVVKGFMQLYGIDYLEVYSPVVRLETLRMLLTLAAIWDYEIDQMDVTTAFLNGPIDVEVYMEQPEGYVQKGKEDWVCKLEKSLYGLKQAPRVWFQLLKQHLVKQGFTIMNCEACVAVKVIDGELVFISIYVDDLILFAPNKKLMQQLRKMMHMRFEMKDLGAIHYILGWEITRNRQERTIFISQRKYADKVLRRFDMVNCNGCKVPSTPDLKLSKVMCPTTREEKELMNEKPYRAVIGSLMYLMLGTRPDLAYLVRECSQFLENPGLLHWRAAKRGLRYLKETMDWGLRLGGPNWSDQKLDDHLKAFADADFANRVDDRKSIAGYLTQFCGSTISWSSQTERTVALHTTEAEYMALSLLVQEVIHLRQMLKELKMKQNNPSDVFVDNESSRKLANNPEFHNRTKHIDVRHHFVRERVELKQITVKRIPGSDNVADAFTKPLPRTKFEQHRAFMGILSKGEYESSKQ